MSRKYLDGVYFLEHGSTHSYVVNGEGRWHHEEDMVEHYGGWKFDVNLPQVREYGMVPSLVIPIHYCK